MFLLGTVMGSFLECQVERREQGIRLNERKRSYCPICGHLLGPLELIPILSFVFLKGRCRHCRCRIPLRHLLCECILGGTYGILGFKYGFSIESIRYLLLFTMMFPATLSDYDTYEIPDRYFLLSALVGVGFNFFSEEIGNAFLQSALGGILLPFLLLLFSLGLEKVLKKETLGGGDLKWLFSIGIYLGFSKSVLNLILMCVIGLISSVFLKKNEKKEIPLMPGIYLSTLITVLYGGWIIQKYTALIG